MNADTEGLDVHWEYLLRETDFSSLSDLLGFRFMALVKQLVWELGGDDKDRALNALSAFASHMKHTKKMLSKTGSGE
jgi:hypothetical protein